MPTSSDPIPGGRCAAAALVEPRPAQLDTAALYDEDYYERGVESGKSCYSNYRWIPSLTIPMAMTLIDTLGIGPGRRVLDFGCAKGYVVKALRFLKRDAWGIDISPYAIEHVHRDVARHCQLVTDLDAYAAARPDDFDFAIAKDVLEHVPYSRLDGVLAALARLAPTLMVVVPLGDGRRYLIDAYERDVTHVIRESAPWWIDRLGEHFGRIEWTHHVPGLKDNWHEVDPAGNAVLIAHRDEAHARAGETLVTELAPAQPPMRRTA